MNIEEIISDLESAGDFSPKAIEIMRRAAEAVEPALAPLPEGSEISRVVEVAILADNSQSMVDQDPDSIPLFHSLVTGLNFCWAELRRSKVANTIEVLVDLMNWSPDFTRFILGQRADVLPWLPLQSVPEFRPAGFIESGRGTELYRRSTQLLVKSICRLHQWTRERNVIGRTLTLILSDGEDNDRGDDYEGDPFFSNDECAVLVREMEALQNHLVFFYGFAAKKQRVDFNAIARGMGVNPSRIKVLPKEGQVLRSELALWSQSVRMASQSADPGAFKEAQAVSPGMVRCTACQTEFPAIGNYCPQCRHPNDPAKGAAGPAAPERKPSSGLDLGFGGMESA